MLTVKRNKDETWREAIIRIASPYGMEKEVLSSFDHDISRGIDEATAAFDACYDWDLCEYTPTQDRTND